MFKDIEVSPEAKRILESAETQILKFYNYEGTFTQIQLVNSILLAEIAGSLSVIEDRIEDLHTHYVQSKSST